MTDCQCKHAGWCQRHQVTKTHHWHMLCQTRQKYFDAWEAGTGPGQNYLPFETAIRQRELARRPPGPGTCLHDLLIRIGFAPRNGCNCHRHMIEMDVMGPAWCRERIETIVDWLQAEAAKRKVLRRLPFQRVVARRLALMAIRRAEKAAADFPQAEVI